MAMAEVEIPAPAPLVVQYCKGMEIAVLVVCNLTMAVCTLPLEYCEFGPSPAECRAVNGGPEPISQPTTTTTTTDAATPDAAPSTDDAKPKDGDDSTTKSAQPAEEGATAEDPEGAAEEDKPKKKKKGKASKDGPQGVTLSVSARGKRKHVTSISGLAAYGSSPFNMQRS